MAGNRTDDIGWLFGKPVNGNKKEIECTFCGKIIKGGITRHKEHLAHKKGNVAPCPDVSAEVKIQMNKLLKDYKEKKTDKTRRGRDVEDEILRDINRDNFDNEDDVAFAMRQSLQQHQFDYEQRNYKESRGNFYDAGGSSQALNTQQMRRSATVRETRRREPSTYDDMSSPAARLRAVEVDIERGQPKKKQSKINTKWFKEAKKNLRRAFGHWMIDNNTPFNAIESKYTNPLIQAIRETNADVRAPTSYELSELYLVEECKAMKDYIASFAQIWKQRGVTLMCDGWSSSTRLHIINFLIYSNGITVFHKTVDASNVPSRDADYYFKIIKKVVEEIGAEKIVQVVTDNEAAIKAAGRRLEIEFPHLYWNACAAHCLDLILKDLSEKTSIGKVIETARKISSYIYRYDWAVNHMRTFTNGGHIIRAGSTRFGTNFVSLESLIKHKNALVNMWNSPEWLSHKLGKSTDKVALEIRELVLSTTDKGKEFWTKANDIIKVYEPLFQVLRLVDGDTHPTMGYIYEAMDKAKLAIQQNCRYFQKFWNIIDKRWNFQLHHDLHAAGHLLNPQFAYNDDQPMMHSEVMQGVKNVIYKLEPVLEKQVAAVSQLFIYLQKSQSFGSTMAQGAVKKMAPAEWWIAYGESVPELQHIAIRVLSQTTSASNCERNWSMFSLVHTKLRNRLTYKKLNLIVYLRYNMKLKIKRLTKNSQAEIQDSLNPINLEHIFDEDDPVNRWLDEMGPPLFEEDDVNWLEVDENNTSIPVNVEGDRQFGAHVQFRYSVDGSEDARDNESEGHLTPPSSDQSGDRGNGSRNEVGTTRTSGYSDDYDNINIGARAFTNDNRTSGHSTQEPTHTYQRRGKETMGNPGNELHNHLAGSMYDYEGAHHVPSNFTRPSVFANSSGSDNYGNSDPYGYQNYLPPPSYTSGYLPMGESFRNYSTPHEGVHYLPHPHQQPPQQPSFEPYYGGSYTRDGNSVINHGTINYGGTHYHQPNYYNDNSTSNDHSWTDTASSMFFPQQAHDNDHNNDDNNQEPARRSFWY